MSGLVTACGAIDGANGALRSLYWARHFGTRAIILLGADEFVTGFTQLPQCSFGEFFRHEYIIRVEG
jgi:hypothetical protein